MYGLTCPLVVGESKEVITRIYYRYGWGWIPLGRAIDEHRLSFLDGGILRFDAEFGFDDDGQRDRGVDDALR